MNDCVVVVAAVLINSLLNRRCILGGGHFPPRSLEQPTKLVCCIHYLITTETMNNNKHIILTFVILAMVPLLVNFYALSRFFVGERNDGNDVKNAAFSTEKMMNAEATQQPPPSPLTLLDFAIVGFAKTGTTFLHQVLANHSQIIMYDDEFWGDEKVLRKWLDQTTLIESTPHNNLLLMKGESKQLIRGIKCPRIIKETARLDQILVNTSRVIVGVRHPVHWFESLYNYRIWQKSKHKREHRIPPMRFFLNNRTSWLGLSTGAARFDLYLKQLGKVPLTNVEIQNMKRTNKVEGVMTSSPYHEQHPMKVLLYTIEQINDTNTTRRLHFQTTLQQFLNLKTTAIHQDIATQDMVNVNNFKNPDIIDICEEQYRDIRSILVWQGKHASEWIRNKFMKSDDVIVSDVQYVNNILRQWGDDPCDL